MNPTADLTASNDRKGKGRGQTSWVWRFSILAMAGIVSYTAVSFWSLEQRLDDMRRDATELQQQLEARQRDSQVLQKEVSDLQTDAYVEKVAREQLGLIRPGEIRYLTGQNGTPPGAASSKTAP